MFRLLAQEVPAARAARGPPVRRAMGTRGQRPAPRRRPGRGRRLRPARPHPRRRRGSRLRPRRLHVARRPPARQDVLLLAGSNAEAAELSRRVQARLAQLGAVGPPQAALADGNQAGVGDLIRARLNTEIDAGGRSPHQPRHSQGHRVPRARRRGAAAAPGRDLDRAVPGPPVLPRPQRRARLRRQRPRRPGPHRRHRPPPRHRAPCPGRPCTSA